MKGRGLRKRLGISPLAQVCQEIAFQLAMVGYFSTVFSVPPDVINRYNAKYPILKEWAEKNVQKHS